SSSHPIGLRIWLRLVYNICFRCVSIGSPVDTALECKPLLNALRLYGIDLTVLHIRPAFYMQTVFKSETTGDQHLATNSFISDSLYNPSKNLSTMLFTETSYKGAWGSPSPSPSQGYPCVGNSGDKLSALCSDKHPILVGEHRVSPFAPPFQTKMTGSQANEGKMT
ncbi:unnamed protein product, partial [Medioppia subpectinata]